MSEMITFDENSKLAILDIFGIAIDEDGLLVEKDNPDNHIYQNYDVIHIDEFAGIMRGESDKLFIIKSDMGSLIELADKLKKR